MSKKLSVRASRASNFRSVLPPFRVLWLAAFSIGWMMTAYGGVAVGQVFGVDDPSDMADSSGDIKRIEAWVDKGDLHLTMTVYGVFAPSTADTPAGMSNRYYYHWLLDTDNNIGSGYVNDQYEGNSTYLDHPIGVDLVVQFGWRDGATNGVYAYDPLTEDEFFEDYQYTIEGDTIHAVIPLTDLGLTSDDIIALSAFQEGASNDWQCDWIESVVMPLTVTKASNPIPATDSTDISRDVVLGWRSGALAVTHNVYLGTDWDDVNDAALPTGEAVDVNSFDPGRLEFGQTYYWRVDEVNGAPDYAAFKGDVWNFTVEPLAYPVSPVTASSNAPSDADTGPENAVNGSGLDADDLHDNVGSNMWLCDAEEMEDAVWILFEFDGVYKLHEMVVWNYNAEFETILGFGIQNATVAYSTDGVEWTSLGDVELAQAPGTAGYAAGNAIDMQGVAARCVRLTVNNRWGTMGNTQYGLSEVRFMYIPVQAREPEPGDAATEVDVNTALTWRVGREAGSHEVYLDGDMDAVASGAALVDTTTVSSYTPADLLFSNTYYWKIIEVNEVEAISAWEGALWSFTVQEYGLVDGFEAYDNDENRIYETWLDGWVNGTASIVGYAEEPFAERSIVNGGEQSMPLEYDNSISPFYSEADRTWASAQDWTAGGAVMLRLYYHGVADNEAAPLYVAVEDSAGNVAVVACDDADAALATSWQAWTIPLKVLADAGVNLTQVKTMCVGLGDRDNPSSGGAGLIFIDDIAVGTPKGDVTAAGDAIQGVPNDGVTTGDQNFGWPSAETPDLAIDDDTSTKYLHFKGDIEATGLQITPAMGATIVTELALTTANDAPGRDPVSFELYGSNEGIDGPYTLIASGDIADFAGDADWPRFTPTETAITFANDVAYTSYQLMFTAIRGPVGGSVNSMQIAEIELIGVLAP